MIWNSFYSYICSWPINITMNSCIVYVGSNIFRKFEYMDNLIEIFKTSYISWTLTKQSILSILIKCQILTFLHRSTYIFVKTTRSFSRIELFFWSIYISRSLIYVCSIWMRALYDFEDYLFFILLSRNIQSIISSVFLFAEEVYKFSKLKQLCCKYSWSSGIEKCFFFFYFRLFFKSRDIERIPISKLCRDKIPPDSKLSTNMTDVYINYLFSFLICFYLI